MDAEDDQPDASAHPQPAEEAHDLVDQARPGERERKAKRPV